MRAEGHHEITSLTELAEINPSAESVKELREAFEEMLQQKGIEYKELGFIPLFPETYVGFSTEIEFESKKITFSIHRRRCKQPSYVSLYVDIGMRTSGGERVTLEFTPDGQARWLSLDRSLFTNRTFPGHFPTKKDLELYRQVINVLRKNSNPNA